MTLVLGLIGFLSWIESATEKGRSAELSAEERRNLELFWNFYEQATQKRNAGNYEQAIVWYKEALKLRPANEESLYYLGACYGELGEYREAVEQYRRIVRVDPQSRRAFARLGQILSTFEPGVPQDDAEARKSLEQSVDQTVTWTSERAEPFLRLGILAFEHGQTPEALSRLGTAAGFGSAEAAFRMGLIEYLRADYPEAIKDFRKTLELNVREKAISGRGVVCAADASGAGDELTALEGAGVKSLLFLYWTSCRDSGYPKGVEKQYRLSPKGTATRDRLEFSESQIPAQRGDRASWADFDRDGDLDLAVCDEEAGLRLYRNDGGVFMDATAELGLDRVGRAWDVVWADVNADSYPDLYVLRGGFTGAGQNALMQNAHGVKFTNVTAFSGLSGVRSTAAARFLDYDRDGRSDLLEAGNASDAVGPVRLYRNVGGARYRQVTRETGLIIRGNATDCEVGDYDGDGRTDLLITRWKQPAVLFRNRPEGRFSDVSRQAGLETGRVKSYSSLFLDYDNDGKLDVLISLHSPWELSARTLIREIVGQEEADPESAPGILLFRNVGNGQFQNVSTLVGLTQRYGVTQVTAADFDGDGWTDLALACGGLEQSRVEPSVILRNQEGRRFIPAAFLPSLQQPARALGVTVVDWDGDQDMDVYLAGVRLFLNQSPQRTRQDPETPPSEAPR
jgi:tetratricopeptide (TPR) repeat protein